MARAEGEPRISEIHGIVQVAPGEFYKSFPQTFRMPPEGKGGKLPANKNKRRGVIVQSPRRG